MKPEAEIYLLYVQDAEPGFIWSRGHVLPPSDTVHRQRVFAALGRTVRRARIDRRTSGRRVVWGRQVLVVEAPLDGWDSVGRELRLTVVVVGDMHDSQWPGAIAQRARQELIAHAFQVDEGSLVQILDEARQLRPNFVLVLWLDSWHSIVRLYRFLRNRVPPVAWRRRELTDTEPAMEGADESS